MLASPRTECASVDAVIETLRRNGYAGWLVIEQDQFLRPTDTPASVKAGQQQNRDYLRRIGL